ncbi:hypothetical protein [Rhodoblastus acidophilus]|nr:hypothetical protein [Rhodoblastus acidophilus]MCW2319024.1 hypothetical protein [Rhodoblastus acidophilus]
MGLLHVSCDFARGLVAVLLDLLGNVVGIQAKTAQRAANTSNARLTF